MTDAVLIAIVCGLAIALVVTFIWGKANQEQLGLADKATERECEKRRELERLPRLPVCEKCGFRGRPSASYCPDSCEGSKLVGEHLHRTCEECGYERSEMTDDAKAREAALAQANAAMQYQGTLLAQAQQWRPGSLWYSCPTCGAIR